MSVVADQSAAHTGPVNSSPVDPNLTLLGRALAEPSRATMLTALMTGTAWTVGELATQAGIIHSTASQHVAHLEATGLVQLHRQGRHTYVTLAGDQLAGALEAVSLVVPPRPVPASLRGQRHARELAEGRTCYHHLAGRVGVALHDHLIGTGRVTGGYQLTPAGSAWLHHLGIAPQAEGPGPALRACMDWTERRPHLAGILATHITRHALNQGWAERGSHPRSIHLTEEGRERLFD